jgi:acetyl esterase/lipase
MNQRISLSNIQYGLAGDRVLLLDLDLPEEGEGPFPVVLWIHGGGWSSGSKDDQPVVRVVDNELRRRGYAIASIDHRLSHEAPFPAQIVDCKAVVRWLRANAEKYAVDVDRIGAWGFSSGGHLAALLGTTGDMDDFGNGGDNRGYSDRVQAVCTSAAPIDFKAQLAELKLSNPEMYEMALSAEIQLLGASPLDNPALAQTANPITYVSSASPPFLLITGDQDGLIPTSQGKLIAQALQQVGVEATTYEIPGGLHGMAGLDEDETSKVIHVVVEFFDRHLKHGK